MECQYSFTTRSRSGIKCGKIDCVSHDPYDCNLAKYMKLPKYFHKAGRNMNKKLYFEIMNFLKRLDSGNENSNETLMIFRIVLDKAMTLRALRTIELRQLLVVCMYRIIDSSSFLNKNKRLRDVADHKYAEFSETLFDEFNDYMKSNIVVGKRFYFVEKNDEYRKKVFRTYVKTMTIANRWFNDMIEERYSPSGRGQTEAKKSFEEKYSRYILEKN
jgi:hypothetical protein